MIDCLNKPTVKTNGHVIVEQADRSFTPLKNFSKVAAPAPPDKMDRRDKIRSNLMGVQEGYHDYKWEIKWGHVIVLGIVHIWAAYGITFFFHVKVLTILFRLVEGMLAGLGVTAGAHRLYCHRAYKAKIPLQVFLLWCYAYAGQNTMYEWVRDHRVHHKFSETDADPHNANRGWFFSHCGWLLIRKHPEVMRRGKTVDMSDIANDPLVAFHTKYFYVLKILTSHVIPVIVPMVCWGETFFLSSTAMIVRFAFTLNATWSVNSFAHLWGNRPIDQKIFPGENKMVSLVALGEGWHNYHHVFPWDYKAAEHGPGLYNFTTTFLDFCARRGLAYDLKQPSKELIMKTAMKHGDGTWPMTEGADVQQIPDRAKAC